MPALASDLRRTLESTVVKARELAERGARDALTALAVGASEPFASMSEEERKLRNRLRAHGRQLGDQRDPQKGSQSIERLVREMAYEHWHRMLFARFLAENQLLSEPSSGVSISLDECEELAAEEGTDLWGLAAQFAQAMLPEIFRTDDPVLELRLPLEIRQQLQGLVAGLDAEVFTASDSLGWTYQFWQTKRKKEVNDSGVKIGADELSPVTQLFTEDYMVDFLLDNTLGAWHAGKMLAADPQLASTAQSECDLRQAVALPGCPWSYLRFVKSDDGTWAPAAGTFEGWPRTAAELKCLDPCMGSGHFVVAMFERLVALRIAEEELSEKSAVVHVIDGNLFGLEIDPRCTQIAAFNLALAAWRRVSYCKLPAMNLACSGLSPNTSEAEWLALAGDNERIRNGMMRLYRLFEKAAVLGSLINPRDTEADLFEAGFEELQPILERMLVEDSKDGLGHEIAVAACGISKAFAILSRQYTLIATNVPFLGRGKQGDQIRKWCDMHHSLGKADLAAAFIERSIAFLHPGGSAPLVSPQHWWFLASYKQLRGALLEQYQFNFGVTLGEDAWQSFGDRGPVAVLFSISKRTPLPSHAFVGIDALKARPISKKKEVLRSCQALFLDQKAQLANPDSRIAVAGAVTGSLLEKYASAFQGTTTGDNPRYVVTFWEMSSISGRWEFFQGIVDKAVPYGGRSQLLLWDGGDGPLASSPEARVQGQAAFGKLGVFVGQMRELAATIYTGEFFNMNGSAVIPKNPKDMAAIATFLASSEFNKEARKIDQALKVTTATLVKVPFDIAHWRRVSEDKYPQGLPKPASFDATQWLFSGHPLGASQSLHVAVARLVGFLWPRQVGSSFPDCPALGPDGLEPLADEDGIVCLAPIRGEAAAADRLRGLLSAAFGDEWSNAKERELLLETAVANETRKAATDLGEWLRQSFFAEHCKLFQSRPFIWQIWDGNPNGFSALVNYHKLAAPKGQGRKTLEQLTYTYLGDWIDRQKLDLSEGINGADDRLAAALDLQSQLKKILDGEPPYDLFVRWKPLHQQAIGWDPDINDGVRLNIRPFLSAQLRKGGKAGAGILRAKPGAIKWTKDRGKEPMRSKDDFPWFWGWDENSQALATDFGAPIQGAPPAGDSFDGNRWNDLHYTRAAKEAARARHRGEG